MDIFDGFFIAILVVFLIVFLFKISPKKYISGNKKNENKNEGFEDTPQDVDTHLALYVAAKSVADANSASSARFFDLEKKSNPDDWFKFAGFSRKMINGLSVGYAAETAKEYALTVNLSDVMDELSHYVPPKEFAQIKIIADSVEFSSDNAGTSIAIIDVAYVTLFLTRRFVPANGLWHAADAVSAVCLSALRQPNVTAIDRYGTLPVEKNTRELAQTFIDDPQLVTKISQTTQTAFTRATDWYSRVERVSDDRLANIIESSY